MQTRNSVAFSNVFSLRPVTHLSEQCLCTDGGLRPVAFGGQRANNFMARVSRPYMLPRQRRTGSDTFDMQDL